MIPIEEMFVRRGGDVGILGPQDANICSHLELSKAPAELSNAEVKDSEPKNKKSSHVSKLLISLFACCFPVKLATEGRNEKANLSEPKKKSKGAGFLRRFFGRRTNKKTAGTFMRKLMRGPSAKADKIPRIEEMMKPIDKKEESQIEQCNSV